MSCSLSRSVSSPIRPLTASSCTSHSAWPGTADLPASTSPGFASSNSFSLFASVYALAQSFMLFLSLHEEAKRGFDGLELPVASIGSQLLRRLIRHCACHSCSDNPRTTNPQQCQVLIFMILHYCVEKFSLVIMWSPSQCWFGTVSYLCN